MERLKAWNAPALGFSLVVAVVAYFGGKFLPMVGGPAFGIILGILAGNLGLKPDIAPGAFSKASKTLLAYSLSLLGFGLSLTQVWAAGISSLMVMLVTMILAFGVAFGVGKWLKIPYRLTALIGMGTAICGGSAISALSPIIKAEDEEISYAISTIFLYNLLAVFIFPPLGHMLGLSDLGFGLWAGTAVNDTSSVLATAYSFGPASGDWAAVVKLTRTTLIVPLCFIFAVITMKRDSSCELRAGQILRCCPKFVLYFLAASIIVTLNNTFNILPGSVFTFLSAAAKLMIIWALAAVGLGSNLRQMAKNGFRPFLLGLFVWAAVALGALGIQWLTGKW